MVDIVITVIGLDRPGLVETLSAVVAEHEGNWLEARLAHLAGQFAGIVRLHAPEERVPALRAALAGLEAKGLRVVSETGTGARPAAGLGMQIELLGLDRPGLVREVFSLLARRQINVEDLASEVYSAPMTGDAMFRARARVTVPEGVDPRELQAGLERLARDLMVDIRLEPQGE